MTSTIQEDVRPSEQAQEAQPLELFYDLVFVFCIMQVVHVFATDLTLLGTVHAVIILMAVWLVWVNTTWVTNELDLESLPVAMLLFAMMLLGLLMAVAIPNAFSERDLLFVIVLVGNHIVLHLFVALGASRSGSRERQREIRILLFFLISAVPWIAGAFASDHMRLILWAIALGIDFGAPLVKFRLPGRDRLDPDVWNVSAGHFSERFELFIMLTLGETIIRTGAATSGLNLSIWNIVAFGLAFCSTSAMWWLHFRGTTRSAERHLDAANDPVLMARDAYHYTHLVIVAGIMVSAMADGLVIAHPLDPQTSAAVMAVVAGPILFLIGESLFQYLIEAAWSPVRLGAAAVMAALFPLGLVLPAVAASAAVVTVLIAVPVMEARLLKDAKPGGSNERAL